MPIPHSKLPWRQSSTLDIVDPDGNIVIYEEGRFDSVEGQANAAYMLIAVNRLPEALKLLKACEKWVAGFEGIHTQADRTLDQLRAFLGQIKKEMK